MKAVVLAMALGGLAGVWVGRADERPAPRERWLSAARTALTGDAQSIDFVRALHGVEQALEHDGKDREAWALRGQLLEQQACREAFDRGEHAAANHLPEAALEAFKQVGPDCRLHPFAQAQLEAFERARP